MGLPCRPQDRKEIQETLPELFYRDERERFNRPTVAFPIFWGELDTEVLSEWGRSCEVIGSEIKPTKNGDVCPVCTKRKTSIDENDCFNLEIAGGINRKSSVPAFMQLVTRNRKTKVKTPIKDVYFTDRFLLADAGEAGAGGAGGGYDHIIKYLESLAVEKEAKFTVHIPSWPSKSAIQKEREDCLSSAQKILKNLIEKNYTNVQFSQLPQKPVFHDRLYLVRGSDSQINGVFGPSLNGLDSQDIALMGEIENKELLDNIDRLLSGRNG